MHPVETYLSHLARIHSTGGGVAETSYYGALEGLLNEIGGKLKPKVRCVPQLKNTGAGSPDFGLYTANQFQRAKDEEPVPGTLPERGVIEVKPWSDDSFVRAKGSQVSKYWDKYCLVLVTNYRDFVLVGRDEAGKAVRLDTYRMAESETAFLEMLAHCRKVADEQGDRLVEFLSRVMLHVAVLTSPQDLAWFLASYAREARYRVEKAADLPALAGLKQGLEEALGIEFEGDKGDHFFRATLVQTLFYGVFSSWVLWSRNHPRPGERFNWHEAGWTLHVPMIKSLFDQIATPTKLKPLGVSELLDRAGTVLNRVERGAFFLKFEEEHAVQYFYEPFLKAYDPELRKQFGVWYTPREIVQYQVERVDRVLREELNIADGLADDDVVILDPCCGTGAYLVETLKRIHKTLEEKGGGALTAQKLKKAAIERVFGFELLPAPFVVSHLQLGLMLRLLGAPLDPDTDERVGVYLTNALTGWEPPREPKTKIAEKTEEGYVIRDTEQIIMDNIPGLREERDAANTVKRDAPILVILGNPPYDGYAGVAIGEERELSEAYRTTKLAPKPQGQGLNELYIRFFRMAERRIVEKSGRGIICYISNYSWLEGLSHTGMREHYIEVFDRIWIDCLNGDKYKTGKVTPWGEPDPSIFSTDFNREGIQVGTAIALLVRKETGAPKDGMRCRSLNFRHLWGKTKHAEILRNAQGHEKAKYEELKPPVEVGYPLFPVQVDAAYLTWPLLPDLFPISFPGVKTSRDEFLVDIDRGRLEERIAAYFNADIPNEEIAHRWPSVMEERGRYQARSIRDYLSKRGRTKGAIVRYAYRPFDVRWLYWEPETELLDRKRSDYFAQVFEGNLWVEARQRQPKADFDRGFFSTVLCDNFGNGLSSFFPLFLKNDLFGEAEQAPSKNLSKDLQGYLRAMGGRAEDLFLSVVAVLRSPSLQEENAAALRQDWPRIPLPATKDALFASAELGRRVAALLDTEKPVDGVMCGKIDPRLKSIAVVSKLGGGALDPAQGHLDMTVGWGHGGTVGACMPGRGRCEVRKQTDEGLRKAFGEKTLDVYLNDTAYWANVPEAIWEYHIGGYQIIKKWLSYREKPLLGRGLKLEEAEYATEMARRIAALILLQTDLDANYEAVKADTWPWPQ
ncbi:MAG: N-6 DNA methylase [Candidatus Hydrogenedentes bacterium]|nr:N-6 DNA methylase [Candidatus Hydrogenedentota bacterium]